MTVFSLSLSPSVGYGFVDFDSPAAAQKAVSSLKATGVQAQMAKVRHFTRAQDTAPTAGTYLQQRAEMDGYRQQPLRFTRGLVKWAMPVYA